MWLLIGIVSVLAVCGRAATEEAIENSVHPLPEKVYVHLHSFMSKSKAFKGFTLEDSKNWIDKHDQFVAPAEFEKIFPFYQSGFDKENRPVWITEVGKYKVRKVVEKGPEATEKLEKYFYKGALAIGKSMLLNDTPEDPVRTVFLIADWDQSDVKELAHLPTLNFLLRLLRTYADILTDVWGFGLLINVNPAAKISVGLISPAAPGLQNKLEVYGSNQEEWASALKKYLPENAIPAWYGGNKDFKPVAVYG